MLEKKNSCKRCGKPVAYEGAVYCGAACCEMFEDGISYPYLDSEIDELILRGRELVRKLELMKSRGKEK